MQLDIARTGVPALGPILIAMRGTSLTAGTFMQQVQGVTQGISPITRDCRSRTIPLAAPAGAHPAAATWHKGVAKIAPRGPGYADHNDTITHSTTAAQILRSDMTRKNLTLTLIAGCLLSVLLTSPASAGTRYAILTSSGWADVVKAGWFPGLVYVDQTLATVRSNKWEQSSESYIGPAGRRYNTYRNVDNNHCLSHVSGIVITAACVGGDFKQWWSTETVNLPPTCWGTFCFRPTRDLLSPWSDPDKVATDKGDTSFLLTTRVGSTGEPSQAVRIARIANPH